MIRGFFLFQATFLSAPDQSKGKAAHAICPISQEEQPLHLQGAGAALAAPGSFCHVRARGGNTVCRRYYRPRPSPLLKLHFVDTILPVEGCRFFFSKKRVQHLVVPLPIFPYSSQLLIENAPARRNGEKEVNSNSKIVLFSAFFFLIQLWINRIIP